MTTALATRATRAADPRIALARMQLRQKKQERDWELRQRVFDIVLSPNMIRLGMVAAIIAYATSEARSSENVGPVRSALAFALPGIGIPLIAADAGIRDKWALGAISAASVGYVTGQMAVGWLGAMAGGNNPFPTPMDIAEIPSGVLNWLKNLGGSGYAPWD